MTGVDGGVAGVVARAEVTWGRGRVHCQVLQEAHEEEEEEKEEEGEESEEAAGARFKPQPV